MKEFGYIKIASYFYLLSIIIGFVFDKSTNLTYQIVFLIGSFILYFGLQMIFYKYHKLKIKEYALMVPTIIKDIIMVSVAFMVLNIIVNLILYVSFNMISNESSMGFIGIFSIINFILFFVLTLFASTFVYYRLIYKNDVELNGDIEEESYTSSKGLKMTAKSFEEDESNEKNSENTTVNDSLDDKSEEEKSNDTTEDIEDNKDNK